MVTEIAPRHQREVFSPHPDDPYLSVEIGLHYLISRLRKQVEIFSNLKNIRMDDKAIIESLSKCVDWILAGGKESRHERCEKPEHVHNHNHPYYVRSNKPVGN